MAQEKFEKHTRTITTQRVGKVDMGFYSIMRIPVRNQQEADLYFRKGVAVYQEETQFQDGCKRIRYYIEVSVYDLAEIASK
jgi:hypothetical protein